MITERHWWRTDDGRLVPDGHPDAAFLAYPRGHEIADHLAEQIGLAAAIRELAGDEADEESEGKEAEKAADKMVAKPSDKGSARSGRRATGE